MMGMLLFLAFALTHLAPFLAPLVHYNVEREHRSTWTTRPLPPRPLEVDTTAYRSGGAMISEYRTRAPSIVRFAALTSLIFGAAFVPGVAWGLVGLMAGGLGIISVPGLVIAAMLWKTGHDLLRGQPAAARRANLTAYLSLALNVSIIAGVVIAYFGFADVAEGFGWLLAATLGYALLSIGQAIVVLRAVDALEDASDAPPSLHALPVP